MKSKSPSPASARSTPSQVAATWVAKRLRPRLPPRAPLLASILTLPLLLSACSSSQFEATEPANIRTIASQQQTVTRSLTLQTPTPGWKLEPVFLYQVGNELWCLHQLTPPDGMAAQMISSVSAEITFVPPSEPAPPIKHFVVGKTWKWNGNPEVTFLDDLETFDSLVADSTLVPILRNPPNPH